MFVTWFDHSPTKAQISGHSNCFLWAESAAALNSTPHIHTHTHTHTHTHCTALWWPLQRSRKCKMMWSWMVADELTVVIWCGHSVLNENLMNNIYTKSTSKPKCHMRLWISFSSSLFENKICVFILICQRMKAHLSHIDYCVFITWYNSFFCLLILFQLIERSGMSKSNSWKPAVQGFLHHEGLLRGEKYAENDIFSLAVEEKDPAVQRINCQLRISMLLYASRHWRVPEGPRWLRCVCVSFHHITARCPDGRAVSSWES